MKTHIRDIRLFNNAGMPFPVCQANAPLLDVDKARWPYADKSVATCKHCQRLYPKRYPWTKTATRVVVTGPGGRDRMLG
jgi:hypothetical protein